MAQPELESLRERLVARTRDLILIPSHRQRPEELARGIEGVANYLDELPQIQLRRYCQNDRPFVLAAPRGVDTPEILMLAHLDVVMHEDPDAYHSRICDGRICGPGAGDMKGQLAVLLCLFHDLHVQYPGLSLALAVTTDEEEGGRNGAGYLFGELGFRAGGVILPDGGSMTDVTVEEKGILHVRLTVQGESAHAARPWLGRNALLELAEGIYALHRHFQKWWNPDDHWHPTCTPTVLVCKNQTRNRLPDRAEAFVDVRFPAPWSAEAMMDEVRAALPGNVLCSVAATSEATRLEPDPLYFEAITTVTGLPAKPSRTDGASDARYIFRHGIPVMTSRPTVGKLHAVDEWIDIESMVQFYYVCLEFLRRRLNYDGSGS